MRSTAEAGDKKAKAQAKAKAAIDRAFELNPELPEASFAMGQYYYATLLDYDKSFEYFKKYIETQPSAAIGYEWIAYVQRRRGQWELAARNFGRAVELDPVGWNSWFVLGEHYLWMRQYDDAARCLRRSVDQQPEVGARYASLACAYLNIDRDKIRATRTMREAIRNAGIEEVAFWSFVPLNRALAFEDDEIGDAFAVTKITPNHLRYFVRANLYEYRGEQETALIYFDSLRVTLETRIEAEKSLTRLSELNYGLLGISYAALGQKDDAIRAGRRAVEQFPLSEDALFGFIVLERMSEIYLRVGEYEAAIDQLEILLSVPSNMSAGILLYDPLWDPLRDNPRFQALIETGP